MRNGHPLNICHIHFPWHKNNDVANCTCKCTNSLSHTKHFKLHRIAQIEKRFFHADRKGRSSILLVLAIRIRDAGHREHYSIRP